MAADVLYAVSIFHFYASYAAGQPADTFTRSALFVGWSVWGREAALAVLAVWAWTRLRGEPSGSTVPGQTSAATVG